MPEEIMESYIPVIIPTVNNPADNPIAVAPKIIKLLFLFRQMFFQARMIIIMRCLPGPARPRPAAIF